MLRRRVSLAALPAMAKVIGSSAALTVLLKQVSRVDPEAVIADLQALDAHIAMRCAEVERSRPGMRNVVAHEAAATIQRLRLEEKAIQAAFEQESRAAVAASAAHQRSIQRWRERKLGWLGRIIRFIAVSVIEHRAARCRAAPEHRRHRGLDRVAGELAVAEEMAADPEAEVSRRMAQDLKRIEQLRRLAASTDAKGAKGELEVIAELARLPGDCVVLNNVHLRAESFMRHEGKPVQSAQVDHLVVGPAGVYLIETKAWSEAFRRGGGYFDPFEQVARAGLLCHCLLKDASLPSRVHNVIVAHGRLEPSRHQKWTQVVAPKRIRQWIEKGRRELSDAEVAAVAKRLAGSVDQRRLLCSLELG